MKGNYIKLDNVRKKTGSRVEWVRIFMKEKEAVIIKCSNIY